MQIGQLLGIVKVDVPGRGKLLLNFYPTRGFQRLSTFSYSTLSLKLFYLFALQYLDDYNMNSSKEMKLVFFMDAIEHVSR